MSHECLSVGMIMGWLRMFELIYGTDNWTIIFVFYFKLRFFSERLLSKEFSFLFHQKP